MLNQTLPAWLKGHTINELGTSIFLWQRKNGEHGDGRIETRTQETYEECFRYYFMMVDMYSEISLGFRWVPHRIMSEQEMLKSVECKTREV